MTVSQLIKALKKFPPNAVLAWQDHDHADDEFNAFVGQVHDAPDWLKEHRGIDVVIRS